MNGEYLALASVVLTAVLLVVVWMRTRPTTIDAAIGSIQSVSEVARTTVAAAEQLWLTGKLPQDQRFTYALDLLQKEFPDLDTKQLTASVEAGVYWLKHLAGKQLG